MLARIHSTSIVLILGFLLTQSGRGQVGDRPEKLPVPEPAKVTEALSLVRSVFADDYTKAKSARQKAALAEEIFKTGIGEEKDAAAKYALFQVARDMAVVNGDVTMAGGVIDAMAEHFAIDAVSMRVTVFAKLARRLRLPNDHARLLPIVDRAIDEAIAADRYEAAEALGKLAAASAGKTRDPALKKQVAKRLDQVKKLKADHAKVKNALAALKENPKDAAANLTVGKYHCFVRGDWETGLGMLALGSDAALKGLAEKDLDAPTSPAEQARLGDAWWDASEKQTGIVKSRMHQRAGAWYNQALPNLSGLAKLRAAKRLEELPEVDRTLKLLRPAAPTGPPRDTDVPRPGPGSTRTRRVDLLALIDVKRDRVSGDWRLDGRELLSPRTAGARIQILYDLPEEYIVEIDATRVAATNCLSIGLFGGGRAFNLVLDGEHGKKTGLEEIDGKDVPNSPHSREGQVLPMGKRRKIACAVRKRGVTVDLDGRRFLDWPDYSRLSRKYVWKTPDSRRLSLGTWAAGFRIHSITLIRFDGGGSSPAPRRETSSSPGATSKTEILLTAKEAKLHGTSIRLNPGGVDIGFWMDPSEWVSWNFSIQTPGTYEIELMYGCPRTQEGSTFNLQVGTEGGKTLASARGTVKATGRKWDDHQVIKYGKTAISTAGKYTLSIKPTHKARMAVMNLRSVRLVLAK